jgi:hypothetical protein
LRQGEIVNERSDVLERALGYPYTVPSGPFVQLGHRTLDPSELEVDLRDRFPLLAYGSNAAPEVLARKLALSDEPVPVEPARLRDFDVVYSAHISPYGAVPGTLQRSPGTVARVCVAHLTTAQLALVSATESNYELVEIGEVDCRLDTGEAVAELSVYLSRHGCLLAEGSEVALAAVEASERRFRELSESQVLEHVRGLLSPAETIEAFVLSCVADPDLAAARTAQIERRELLPA